ncbi:14222_t:CDS:2, partial [Acaulospora morrowiae]
RLLRFLRARIRNTRDFRGNYFDVETNGSLCTVIITNFNIHGFFLHYSYNKNEDSESQAELGLLNPSSTLPKSASAKKECRSEMGGSGGDRDHRVTTKSNRVTNDENGNLKVNRNDKKKENTNQRNRTNPNNGNSRSNNNNEDDNLENANNENRGNPKKSGISDYNGDSNPESIKNENKEGTNGGAVTNNDNVNDGNGHMETASNDKKNTIEGNEDIPQNSEITRTTRRLSKPNLAIGPRCRPVHG